MANTPAATVIGCESGISVTADSGFNEVWNGEDCLGYVKGPGEESFPMKPGKHEIVVYCAGRIVLRKTVTVGAEPEAHETEKAPEKAPEEAYEAEAADKPAQNPDQPAGEPARSEYTLVKTETLELLIEKMRDLAAFLEALLPIGKTE